MSRWFRHYAGMMRDEKLVRAALKSKQPIERVVWVWGAILESAAEKDQDGLFEIDAAEIAYFLRADEVDIRAVLDGLAHAGRVAADRVVKWGDRQYQSDRSAERQAKYRERKRTEVRNSDDQQTSDDSDVASLSRHGDAPETDTELEEETEKNISLETEREFEDWYSAFPKHVGKGAARKAYRSARKKTAAETLLAAAKTAKVQFAASEPQFVPHPASWLNAERWLDQPPTPAPRRSWRDDPEMRGVI